MTKHIQYFVLKSHYTLTTDYSCNPKCPVLHWKVWGKSHPTICLTYVLVRCSAIIGISSTHPPIDRHVTSAQINRKKSVTIITSYFSLKGRPSLPNRMKALRTGTYNKAQLQPFMGPLSDWHCTKPPTLPSTGSATGRLKAIPRLGSSNSSVACTNRFRFQTRSLRSSPGAAQWLWLCLDEIKGQVNNCHLEWKFPE